MEEKETNRFSWPALFFVTGICCFAFRFVLKILEGNYSGFFLIAGIVAMVLGLLSWLVLLLIRSVSKDNEAS